MVMLQRRKRDVRGFMRFEASHSVRNILLRPCGAYNVLTGDGGLALGPKKMAWLVTLKSDNLTRILR